jgi:hypothetical protein
MSCDSGSRLSFEAHEQGQTGCNEPDYRSARRCNRLERIPKQACRQRISRFLDAIECPLMYGGCSGRIELEHEMGSHDPGPRGE